MSNKMKTAYNIFTFFALLFLFNNLVHSQTFDVSLKWNGPNGNKLNDVYLLNSITALAVGDRGTFWKTTNGGNTWTLMEIPWTDDCMKVWMTDNSTIFVVTKDSADYYWRIRRSTDNGSTWTSKSIGTRAPNSAAMLTKDYGYFLSGYSIARTANFFYSASYYAISYPFTEVSIIDSMNIIASGYYNYLSRSVNGGTTWSTVNCGKAISGLTMIDSVGYAISSTNRKDLYKTTDRGNSFSLTYSFPDGLLKLSFSGRDTGFALTSNGREGSTIYKTVNGGTSWTAINDDMHLLTVSNFQKPGLIAVGSGGRIAYTTNSGSYWRSNNKIGYDLNCVEFPTKFTGYVGANDGVLYKFYNWGESYSKYIIYPVADIHTTLFLDSLTGFVAGEKGMIKKTTNGGSSFTDCQFPDTNSNITVLTPYRSDDSWYGFRMRVFLCNSAGKVYLSEDTCRTWNEVAVPNSDYIVDGDGIYFGSNSGNVYKYNTVNSTLSLSMTGVLVNKVRMGFRPSASYSGDNEAYAIDNSGLTAGKKFNYQWQTGERTITAAKCFLASSGRNFVTGDWGGISSAVESYAPGITGWEQIHTPTHASINSIAERTSSEYWAVGDDGTLLILKKNPAPQFTIALDTAYAVAGDTAVMNVDLDYLNSGFSSVQFSLYSSTDITLVGIDTAGTLVGKTKWNCFVNGSTSPAQFAAGGANDITTTGTLVRLKFRVNNGVVPKNIPVSVSALTVNNGTHSPNVSRDGVVKVVRYGDIDVNGVVQAYDASLILKHLVNYITLTPAQKKIADVSKDGTLSDVDASLIFRYVVGLIDSLPAPGTYLATGIVNMNDFNANAGQIINIPVSMTGVTGLMGLECSITFDAEKLEFTGATATGIASGFNIEHKVTSGKILLAAASQTDAGGSGESIILHFRVKNNALTGNTKVKIARMRLNENPEQFDVAESNINIITGLKDNKEIPTEYGLSQNYPNPFNPETRIDFAIPEVSMVSVQIFNSLGEKVGSLIEGEEAPGYYNLNWNAANHPTCIYIIKMTATSNSTGKSFTRIRKMILVK